MFTAEQRAAITLHDRPLIVTAGAGSGKTRVLVERFIALLDAHPDWSLPSVVAITFTEKAAREMRDRVRTAVERRIRDAVQDSDDARRGAGDALERWLDHQAALTRARIGTIHALCAALLRANPAEAAIDPAFEVLDEVEAAILREEAVEAALADAANDADLAALLVAHGVDKLRGVLRAYAGTGPAAEVARAIPDDPAVLLAHWREQWLALAAEAQAAFRSDIALETWLAAWPPESMPSGDRITAIWDTVRHGIRAAQVCPLAEFAQTLSAAAAAINLQGGSPNAWGSREALAEAKDALKTLRAALDDWAAAVPPFPAAPDEAAAGWLRLWRGAIALAAGHYAARKAARAALDFDDLETRARRLLIDHPAVAARYAGREFNHILVDEFQDTNDAQRDLIYRLAGLAGDRASQPNAAGRLFVVGDPKQSIYAFRGADVRVFGAVRDDLIARGGQELPLSQSFRTHAALVDACNDLFGRILGPDAFGPSGYEVGLGVPMTAFRPAPDDPRAAPGHPMTVIAVQRPLDLTSGDLSSDDLRRWEAALLADQIHALVESGRLIWDRDLPHDALPEGAHVPPFAQGRGAGAYRPVRYGDVAVLFQAGTHQPDYEEVFKAAALPFLTIAGRGYFGQQEVRDLLNLLSVLHNPGDDLALASALRSPLFGLSDEALLALRLGDEGRPTRRGLWAALMDETPPALLPVDEIAVVGFARDVLRDLREGAGRAPIADILTAALERTGFLAALTGLSGGARRRGNVEKLVALARASGRISLGAFNAYARDLTAREAREGEAVIDVGNAVRLMSVHASKGLEFPVVILADAAWTRADRGGLFALDPVAGAACTLPQDDPDDKPPQPFAWQRARWLAEQRDQAERRRLLYVGATRAGDHLIVSGTLTRRTAPSAWLWQWLAALGAASPGEELIAADEPAWIERPWGRCALLVPRTPPGDLPARVRQEQSHSAWDDLPDGPALDALPPADLPLLRPVPVDAHAPARHLAATLLHTLGRAPYFTPVERGYAAFRDAVLHDAPGPLQPLPERRPTDARLQRIIGEMVHRALQHWMLLRNTPRQTVIDRLDTYAWDLELTDPAQRTFAKARALDLLLRFEASPICTTIERAPQVYRELPFVHQHHGRVIHGVIDVVYFDGKDWHVLDYKTTTAITPAPYLLQIAAYAAALTASMGQEPQAHLYFIHHGRLWDVHADEWRAALDRLDDEVNAALDGPTPMP